MPFTATTPTLNDILSEMDDADGKIASINVASNSSIRYPYTLEEFYKYLINCHCNENLEFLLATKKFLIPKRQRSSAPASSTEEREQQRQSYIEKFDLNAWNEEVYDQFIDPESPLECNFPQNIKSMFEKCYRDNSIPKQCQILTARQHAATLLLDPYRKFLSYVNTSPIYNNSFTSSEQAITNIHEGDSPDDERSLYSDDSSGDQHGSRHQHNNNNNHDIWTSSSELQRSSSLGTPIECEKKKRGIREIRSKNIGVNLRKSKTYEPQPSSPSRNKFLDSSKRFFSKMKFKSKRNAQ
ncbi:GTPase-activating protein RGS2 NDAI_0B04220 [Naumovozyma dairenensis CBS 421]|uniref:RGS domain-containing protein n=1 Tax=Naumovozyma dairenensis (strain ATCC 10597 / BCRC 20456 / CBS 421 / NBRC 0211 / NRRL Y-12639) TaxID=1071378 RepID=G0W6P5_NAUDC|nr:hypothetical protein NDAI_0B04220 [Naumovozyma dairenensis CBS 421]CCD23456.1 hypothetical protein NDAI_0B04220 [Naumovozyma dairenensis CBS 421]